MKVEFIFRPKGLKLNVAEVQAYVNQKLAEFPFRGLCESVTQMSKWLVVLVDFPNLKAHPRIYHEPVELWWEVLAGYIARARADVLEVLEFQVDVARKRLLKPVKSLKVQRLVWRGKTPFAGHNTPSPNAQS
ncbi:MAG: hypothetical protein ACP5JW_08115 [Candidatus Bathyarchaeia archaeon]